MRPSNRPARRDRAASRARVVNVGREAFDKKMQALEALRAAPASSLDEIRRALKDRNNYLVSKAAALAGELGLQELAPELLAAFSRFLEDAAKRDPQCWAKNAIVKALKDLGHDDATVYIRGAQHVQMEPVWGGQVDTAATLRGACALALAACTLDRVSILTRLVDLLADPEKRVRIDAACAMEQLSGCESELLLRLKALAGDKEPEVIGECFAGLLNLAPAQYLPFVARFLEKKNGEVRFEAVAALGECNELQAVDILRECWRTGADREMKQAIVLSLGASRQPAAVEFLLTVVAEGSVEDAAASLATLAAGRSRLEVKARVAEAIVERGEVTLTAAFEREFG